MEANPADVQQLLAGYPEFMHKDLRDSAEVAVRATGMALDEATGVAEAFGVSAWVVDADHPPAMTMELVVNSVKFWVRDGTVTKVSIG